jgi:hypothetical protein
MGFSRQPTRSPEIDGFSKEIWVFFVPLTKSVFLRQQSFFGAMVS